MLLPLLWATTILTFLLLLSYRLTTSALLLRHYPGAELSHFNNQDDYFQLLYATLQQVVSNTQKGSFTHYTVCVSVLCGGKAIKNVFHSSWFYGILEKQGGAGIPFIKCVLEGNRNRWEHFTIKVVTSSLKPFHWEFFLLNKKLSTRDDLWNSHEKTFRTHNDVVKSKTWFLYYQCSRFSY